MCITAVIRKETYIDMVFIRDEQKSRSYADFNQWWSNEIFGYLDIKTHGTWLANSPTLLACLLNRESLINNNINYNSRGNIILDILENCITVEQAQNRINKTDYSDYKPFNLLVFGFDDKILYVKHDGNTTPETHLINYDFFVLNRSFINDFNQERIKRNYAALKKEMIRGISNNTELIELLKKSSFCHNIKDEYTLSLKSEEWETQVISLIHIDKINKSFEVKTVE